MTSSGRELLGNTACIAAICAALCMLYAGGVSCAEVANSPIRIDEIRLSWVGPDSQIDPKEKGERSFWRGGRPQTSSDYSARDRLQEGAFSGNWGKIDVEFTTLPEWTDEVTFNFYLLVKGKESYTVLCGSTTAIFVARGQKHYVVMYAYPNAIARYGGEATAIAVEAVVKGQVASVVTNPRSKDEWWKSKDVKRAEDVMVDWMFTPMRSNGAEGYELVKVNK